MPYITSQFMPRKEADRPKVVPDGCVNLGFLGQFVETPGDVVFTVEMSVRTAMEAVYQLTGLDKEPLEVFPSRYDLRYFVGRLKQMNGIHGPVTTDDLPRINPLHLHQLRDELLQIINRIPPYPPSYPGRDRTVPEQSSILSPQAPHRR